MLDQPSLESVIILKLTIIIPAFNEENAIASIITKTQAARGEIIDKTVIDDVDIIVVNDGSTDKTSEIASTFQDIRLINFRKNKGYGAAIKAGFAESRADYVSFLDADGTCDPLFFVDLVNLIVDEDADVVMGNRMTKTSQMPPIRKIGNHLFALLLRVWSNQKISDIASGIRVIKRKSLSNIYPLPDGLHFTPAMCARAMFDRNLKILELPMPEYKERIGISKLSVVGDGIRFLRVIIDTAISYSPRRFFGTIGLIILLISLFYAIEPVLFFLINGNIEPDMVYRIMAIVVGFVTGIHLFATGILSQLLFDAINQTEKTSRGMRFIFEYLFVKHGMLLGSLSVLIAIILNWNGIIEYLTNRTVSIHWLYVFFGGCLVILGSILIATGVLGYATMVAKERIKIIKLKNK